MRKAILLTLFVFIAVGLSAQFRSTEWGMSREAVKSTEETAIVSESEIGVMYRGDIAGLECQIVYYFVNDQLFQAGYSIVQSHSNRNKYIDDFTKLKELLIKKYGKPDVDEIRWENTLFRDRASEWGTAISMGHLNYYCIWDMENTEISLALTGDNFNINHFIIYKSKALSEKQEELREKEMLEQL